MPSRNIISFWIGIAGFVIGIIGISLGIYFYYHPKAGPPSATDKFVLRTNPVRLNITQIQLKEWMGDPAASLTLYIENNSQTPVDNINAIVAADGHPFPPFQSKAFSGVDMNSISIPAGTTLQLPVASQTSFKGIVGSRVCGAGLHAIDLAHSAPSTCQPASSVHSTMFNAIITYNTIFSQKNSINQRFWVYSCDGCADPLTDHPSKNLSAR